MKLTSTLNPKKHGSHLEVNMYTTSLEQKLTQHLHHCNQHHLYSSRSVLKIQTGCHLENLVTSQQHKVLSILDFQNCTIYISRHSNNRISTQG